MGAPIHLTDAVVRRLFTPEVAFESARRAFAALGRGQVVLPPRLSTPIAPHDALHLSMPCYLNDAEGEVLAMKAVTLYPRNRARGLESVLGFITLYDAATGDPLAFIDAATVTARRTAAGCALASRYLARADSTTLAVFGAGRQAEAHIEALAAEFKLERVRVFSTDQASAGDLCSRLSARIDLDLSAVGTPSKCLDGADIVCTTTNSATPVFAAESLAPGAHINAIGSHQATTAEFDPTLVPRALVFVDDLGEAKRGAGELIQASEKCGWSWNNLAGELADLVLERKPGRPSPDQTTIFKSVGLAVQDATAAHAVYERAVAEPE
ncbi:MAG TPA: ornithine cyclodeaminase family protein [Fimbriimonadaceae bacterium]|nr:ornithine cyclodeaminase family protein [Fimbriimonadaceae bacterium]